MAKIKESKSSLSEFDSLNKLTKWIRLEKLGDEVLKEEHANDKYKIDELTRHGTDFLKQPWVGP